MPNLPFVLILILILILFIIISTHSCSSTSTLLHTLYTLTHSFEIFRLLLSTSLALNHSPSPFSFDPVTFVSLVVKMQILTLAVWAISTAAALQVHGKSTTSAPSAAPICLSLTHLLTDRTLLGRRAIGKHNHSLSLPFSAPFICHHYSPFRP